MYILLLKFIGLLVFPDFKNDFKLIAMRLMRKKKLFGKRL